MVLRRVGGCGVAGRREVDHTARLFGDNCGYSRSMMTTFTSVCKFARRRTLHVTTSFNKNVKHVHRAYNTTYNVFLLTKLRGKTVSKTSHRKGTTGCTLIRRLTTRFGGQGNSLGYNRLLNLGGGTPISSRPRTQARRCCTGEPYSGVMRRTTEV